MRTAILSLKSFAMAMTLFSQPVQADEVVIVTSRFFLMITDPCEQPGSQGPTWCTKALFRLVRKPDCREFKPQGQADIRYCVRSSPDEDPTPCEDLGYTFYFGGLTYTMRRDRMYAEDQPGNVIWTEVPTFVVTKSPNPSFQRTGKNCELPAAELQR